MRALILAGGYGTRLRPITYFTPKPMIRINGKPVIEYIVDNLNSIGINEIIINLHYKPLHFMRHFGSRLLYTYEPKLLGEEGTIRSIKKWFKKDFLLVQNGDTLTNLDILRMYGFAKGNNVRYMDGKIYAGLRIIGPDYYEGQSEIKYYDSESTWLDIGTKKNLKKAPKYVEELSNMWSMRKLGN